MYSPCVVGTADGNTRHEAKASAPACVGLGIRAGSWKDKPRASGQVYCEKVVKQIIDLAQICEGC